MTTLARSITGGVDTHLDVHVAAALDDRGALLGVESFTDTAEGYKLLGSADFAPVELVGVKGTGPMAPGSLGSSGPRGSASSKWTVRIANGVGARASPIPKTPSPPPGPPSRVTLPTRPSPGKRGVHRVLRVARASARKGRTQAFNQMRNLVSTAPEPIRDELRALNVFHLLERTSAIDPEPSDVVSLTKLTLRMLAKRAIALEVEITEIDAILTPLVNETAPELIAALGLETDTRASQRKRGRPVPQALHRADRCSLQRCRRPVAWTERRPSARFPTQRSCSGPPRYR